MRIGIGLRLNDLLFRATASSGTSAFQQILNLATADGWTAVYDPTNNEENNPGNGTVTLNGSNIASIADGLGNWPDLAQGTSASQPALTANGFGDLSAFTFDDGDFLTHVSNVNQAQPIHIQLLLDSVIDVRDGIFSDTAANFYCRTESNETFTTLAGSSLITSAAHTASPEHLAWTINGVSSEVWRNGVSIGTGNAGANQLTALVLGVQASNFLTGSIGPVTIYLGNPSSTIRGNMTTEMMTLGGL